MKTYRIGEFARMLGVSTQTVRNYEKKGLLQSNKLPSGYRYFTEEHLKIAKRNGLCVKESTDEEV